MESIHSSIHQPATATATVFTVRPCDRYCRGHSETTCYECCALCCGAGGLLDSWSAPPSSYMCMYRIGSHSRSTICTCAIAQADFQYSKKKTVFLRLVSFIYSREINYVCETHHDVPRRAIESRREPPTDDG
jgi:hypothetical protein